MSTVQNVSAAINPDSVLFSDFSLHHPAINHNLLLNVQTQCKQFGNGAENEHSRVCLLLRVKAL